MKLSFRLLSTSCFVLVFSCAAVFAQTTAQLNGRVEDPTGARLPGVEVTARQIDTGVSRLVITNETGSYTLPNLPLGPYELEATLPGFSTFLQSGIVLAVGSSPNIIITLEVGQVAQTIEVTASAALVETRTLGIGELVASERILDLPLNGRNVTQLILLAGGAVQTELDSPHRQPRGAVEMSVGGGAEGTTLYSLDGAIHVDPHNLNNLPMPFPDALQEFKVESSSTSPAAGTFSGAWVNAVTRSGTNAFHGSAFEFVRNDALNARSYYASEGDTLKRNQFGGTIGGPIVPNKLFFFFGAQLTTLRTDPTDLVKTVLNTDMANGDFSTFMSSACRSRPEQLNQNGTDGGLFFDDNNRVLPGAPFSVVARTLMTRSDWPGDQADECGILRFGQREIQDQNNVVTRIDYQITDNHSLFGRYLGDFYNEPNAYALEGGVNILHNERSGEGFNNGATSYAIGLTSLLGPNLVNSFSMGVNRHSIVRFVTDTGTPDDYGANTFAYPVIYPGADTFKWDNDEFDLGSRTGPITTMTYSIGNSVNYLRGDHQFTFGGSYAHWRNYSRSQAHSAGTFTTDDWYTDEILVDFYFGALSAFRQATPIEDDSSQDHLGLFFSDTWQATDNLTLNLGVRWEPRIQLVMRSGHNVNFDVDRYNARQSSTIFVNSPYGLVFPGESGYAGNNSCRDNGVCLGSGFNNRNNQFAPRIGFAWDIAGDGRTALRAGFGTAYDILRMSAHIGEQMTPWQPDIRRSNVFADDPFGPDESGRVFPGGNPFPTPFVTNNDTDFDGFQSGSVIVHNPDAKSETKYLWNLSIQHQLGNDMMVEATYIGNRSVHVWDSNDLNPQLYVPGPRGRPEASRNDRRLFNLAHPTTDTDEQVRLLTHSRMNRRGDQNSGSYNGMILKFQRRGTSGVGINANYTWSHAILTDWDRYERIGGNVPEAAVNPFVREIAKYNADADRRHIFNASIIAESPQFANNTLRMIGSDWKASLIYRLQSGEWLTIDGGSDTMSDGGRERAVQLSDNVYGDRSTRRRGYFNEDAFERPARGTYGTVGRASVEGPGTWAMDMALARTFALAETQNLEVRVEAFNVTNSFRPLNPGRRIGRSNFGRIDESRDPRIFQFALKYIF